MIECVLFDLDGMLVDSSAAIVASCDNAFIALGLAPRSADDVRRIIGPPLLDGFATLLIEGGDDPALAGELVLAYREHYRDTCAASTPLFDGITELLVALDGHTRMAVATSKPIEFASEILRADGVAHHFETIVGPDLRDPHETKTVTVGRALDTLGHPRAVMVGDRSFDIEAGRAHGLLTVGVTWGNGSRRELGRAGADHLVDSPSELLSLLFEL